MDITVLKLKKDPMVAELAAAVGYKFNTRKEKDPNTVMKAIVEMVADPEVLSDEKWETLSEAAQAYYNACAEVVAGGEGDMPTPDDVRTSLENSEDDDGDDAEDGDGEEEERASDEDEDDEEEEDEGDDEAEEEEEEEEDDGDEDGDEESEGEGVEGDAEENDDDGEDEVRDTLRKLSKILSSAATLIDELVEK